MCSLKMKSVIFVIKNSSSNYVCQNAMCSVLRNFFLNVSPRNQWSKVNLTDIKLKKWGSIVLEDRTVIKVKTHAEGALV